VLLEKCGNDFLNGEDNRSLGSFGMRVLISSREKEKKTVVSEYVVYVHALCSKLVWDEERMKEDQDGGGRGSLIE
jgi:hypothetical protein